MGELDITGVGELDLAQWDKLWETLCSRYASLGGMGLGEFISSLASGQGIEADGGVLNAVKELALSGFGEAFLSYSALIAIAAAAAVTGVVSGDKESTGNAAGFICFCAGAVLTAASLTKTASLVSASMELLLGSMELSLPVLTAALAATGSPASGALMQPLTGLLSFTVANVFGKLILPLASAAGVAAMLCALVKDSAFSQIFAFFKSAVKWITGAVFTIYFGIVSIQGLTVARTDSIALRTAKYTLDKSVPIVGGAVSGTMDTLIASAAVIKNAAGAAAVVCAVLIAASPLIGIACSSLACRAVAAVCAPLGDKRIPDMLSKTAEVYALMFAALTACALMFIITVGLVFAAGNP